VLVKKKDGAVRKNKRKQDKTRENKKKTRGKHIRMWSIGRMFVL